MEVNLSARFASSIAVLFLTFCGSPSVSQESLKLKAYLSMDMPASGYNREIQAYTGFEVDLIRTLLKDAPIAVTLEFSDAPNWKRALEHIRLGEANFLTLVSYRKERESFMDYIGVFNTEAAYLITQEGFEVSDLKEIEDLALGEGFVAIDEAISWNPEFDRRLAEDESFRKNFVIKAASEYNRVLDADRLEIDSNYRNKMSSGFEGVYEDGNAALISTAQRISYGRLGGTIVIQNQAVTSIDENANRISKGGAGAPLKATRIEAFGEPVTFLVSSLYTPIELREHIKKRYNVIRQNGEFDEVWMKWYGIVSPPDNVAPGEGNR